MLSAQRSFFPQETAWRLVTGQNAKNNWPKRRLMAHHERGWGENVRATGREGTLWNVVLLTWLDCSLRNSLQLSLTEHELPKPTGSVNILEVVTDWTQWVKRKDRKVVEGWLRVVREVGKGNCRGTGLRYIINIHVWICQIMYKRYSKNQMSKMFRKENLHSWNIQFVFPLLSLTIT